MLENKNMELVLIKDLWMLYPTENSKRKFRYGLYKCFCGNEFKTQISDINKGTTKSCGCFQKQRSTTHGLNKHRLYNIWAEMKARCNNQKNKHFNDYGGRGITVCDRWLDVRNFIDDMYPTFKDGLSIDRIDNNKGYSKDNCRWTTNIIQSRNTRLIRINNSSGYRGVSFNKKKKKFVAQIMVNLKYKHLGYFDTAIDGAKAYNNYVINNNLEHTKNNFQC